MKKLWIGIIILIVTLATVFVITKSRKTSEEIKIGAILPLTGPAALVGEWSFNGINLAEEYINERGGVNGKTLKVIIEDGMADPKQSISAYYKLTKTDQISVITSIVSSVDLSLVPLVKKDNFFFLSNAAHPELSSVYHFIFRHSQTAQQEAHMFSNLLISNNIKEISILSMNDEYARAFTSSLLDKLKNTSIKNSITFFDKEERDFRTIVAKALRTKPQGVVISGFGKHLSELIITLKELGYKGQIITCLGLLVTGAIDGAGGAARGIYSINFKIDTTSSEFQYINERYHQKYGTDIPTGALLFFNSILLLENAIENAGYNPEKMADYLRRLSSFEGIGETMSITETNDIWPALEFVQF